MMRHFILVPVCMALLLYEAGCDQQPSAFPLALESVRRMDSSNTAQIIHEEKGGEIFLRVTDKHGDVHVHTLVYEGANKQQALEIIRRKQAELEAGQ